ncbi:type II secretion system F family protein [Microbacterium amylolyticum]|uniref:Tight adherence protein B n=1 Tax=Microbacterium amylolyticum TaxID=936337 RepID=A0ABS4ZJL9_9MICO|nr:type II secretion system F family protein [Microbacterium amylolyticum]MBP2437479.1 tight adherence protein B [Microbacterium amylolyticum]
MKKPEARVSDPGATVLPLAVLLEAGANPATAWRDLAVHGDEAAKHIVDKIDAGTSVAQAIASRREHAQEWGDVAAAWEVSETVGAPLADALRAIASSLRDAGELRDDTRVALAEPMASARLMAWLPVLGIVVGIGLGLDPLGVLFASPIGALCLITGLALMVGARVWTARLVRAARPRPGTPGMYEELLAIALSGGTSISRARAVVASCDEWTPAAAEASEEADRVLELSRNAGVPAAELLRASAGYARHLARTEGRLRGARLGTRLLLPMGVCTLPAFLLLGVAPMLIGILGATPLPMSAG